MATLTQCGCPSSLIDLLRARARQYGSKLAFRFLPDTPSDPVEITYEELDWQAARIAGRLQALCGTGERVLLIYPPGLDYVSAFFGCVYSGNLAVPVFPPRPYRPSPRLKAIVEDSRPAIVMSTSAIEAKASDQYGRVPELLELPWLVTDDLSDGDEGGDADWTEPAPAQDRIAFLQYTSGSTAKPKGVMVSHQNLIHNSAAIQQAFATVPDDHGVFWLPLYHDMGLIGGMLQTVYAGASSTLMSPLAIVHRPLSWLEAISRTRATVSGGPDFAYDLCCRKIGPEAKSGLDLSSWRLAFSGAETVRADTIERFADAFGPQGFRREAFFPCYGLAEATLLVSGGKPDAAPVTARCQATALALNRVVETDRSDCDARVVVGCGGSVDGQRIAIVNPETHLECPVGRVGEVWVSGPSVAGGYFNAPGPSDATFRARLNGHGEGPFLRTGDLGFLRDGELFITGRLKDLIVICGRNYYPQDIEKSVQESHPRLRPNGGVAFSIEIDGREQLVVAHEVERSRGDLDADDIITAIRQAVTEEHDLEPYCVALLKPGSVLRTSSGKVRRCACREAFLSNRLQVLAYWTTPITSAGVGDSQDGDGPPHCERKHDGQLTVSQIRKLLIQRLSARLGVPEKVLKVDKPFVEFGMSSLQAVALAEELAKWINRPVSPAYFFNYPTIGELAAHLANGKAHSPCRSDPEPPDAGPSRKDIEKEASALSDEAIASLISQELKRSK